MVVSRAGLKLIDNSSNEYDFPIAIDAEGKRFISIEAKSWEPGDPAQEWRVALHPWDEGVGPNRIEYDRTFNGDLVQVPTRTYALANMDLSWPGIMVPPPLLTSLAINPETSTARVIQFNGAVYVVGVGASTGNALYKIAAADYTVSLIKDFGSGSIIHDIEEFNSELVFGMGTGEKIWTMNTSETFTQATDNVFLQGMGRVGNTLWAADYGTNGRLLFSCTSAPRTLASWTPANPNQYPVGDTTTGIIDILDFGGVPAVVKNNGVFFPDAESVFHNQTPQLQGYGTLGVTGRPFTAWGYLWVPSKAGLLRISYGESVPMGPQLTGMPKFNMDIHSGFEWAGDIYLLVTPQGTSDSKTSIFKMQMKGDRAVYHQIAQFSGITTAYAFGISPVFTNPSLIIGVEDNYYYAKLGRGGGRHIDDTNYAWGTASEWRSGDFVPNGDLALESYLVGVDVVADLDSSETLTCTYERDRSGSFTTLKSAQYDAVATTTIGGSGAASGFARYSQYADPENNTAQMFNIKITGSTNAGTGADRFEVREVWAYGYSHPKVTDTFVIGIYADTRAKVRGIGTGRRSGQTFRLFRNWYEQGTIFTMQITDYGYDAAAASEAVTVKVRVVGVKKDNLLIRRMGEQKETSTDLITVILRRTDFAPFYGDND